MKAVFLQEFRELPRRLGGAKGFFSLAALAALAALPPYRFGHRFLDPVFLFAYACFALLFSAFFTAQSFAGSRERQQIENRPGVEPADPALVWGKVLAATLYGWLAWLVIFTSALALLSSLSGRLALPPSRLLLSLTMLAAGLAFFAAGAGSVVALQVLTAGAARQLFRLAFLFLLLLAVVLPRLLPSGWTSPVALLLTAPRAASTAAAAALLLVLAGLAGGRRSIALLAEKRAGLSILQ